MMRSPDSTDTSIHDTAATSPLTWLRAQLPMLAFSAAGLLLWLSAAATPLSTELAQSQQRFPILALLLLPAVLFTLGLVFKRPLIASILLPSTLPPILGIMQPEDLRSLGTLQGAGTLSALLLLFVVCSSYVINRRPSTVHDSNKLGEQAKRPIDKHLGEQAKRPIDKHLGEQAKRPIDKHSGEQAKRPIDKKLLSSSHPEARRCWLHFGSRALMLLALIVVPLFALYSPDAQSRLAEHFGPDQTDFVLLAHAAHLFVIFVASYMGFFAPGMNHALELFELNEKLRAMRQPSQRPVLRAWVLILLVMALTLVAFSVYLGVRPNP
ncbi:MAG: hypothetical protein RBU37_20900 [Myxococcota bacterium]|jgi:hypothetical protein|nr:hypothetical protein [Myxococcota bacterium]